jgi:hypothetical protein
MIYRREKVGFSGEYFERKIANAWQTEFVRSDCGSSALELFAKFWQSCNYCCLMRTDWPDGVTMVSNRIILTVIFVLTVIVNPANAVQNASPTNGNKGSYLTACGPGYDYICNKVKPRRCRCVPRPE